MIIARLALQSLRNRWITVLLTILAISVSVMLLLGVEKVRSGARDSFAGTVSGADVIIGARSGGMQLLLYSVFRIGNATNNVTWRSYEDIVSRKEVAWAIPLSLGDSHRGYRVIGTTTDYFEHLKYRRGQTLKFEAGGPFDDLFDVVLGSEVASRLGYSLGDQITLAHGAGSIGSQHDDLPFRVSGILVRTGTPADKSLHVSLKAIEAIHVDWRSGSRIPGQVTSADRLRQMSLPPSAITAAIIGLKSRLQVISFQRAVNEYRAEPLSAVLPGLALQEMWALVGTAETALLGVSVMVVVTSMLGLSAMILSTLNERRREIAILRSLGARPRTIAALLVGEATLLTLAGIAIGTAALYAVLMVARPLIDRQFGIDIVIQLPSTTDAMLLLAILVGGILAGLLPAYNAYRTSLADGMMVRT
ncbi:peptide ABC transporter permease [Nitratireductor aestuarii]|uniref:Peptide ABC transporter permease n=1 Tax=Nitratireductor aestuarii TaxID=1735103 RepID=A0A916W5R7_9HYPH|nr:FtsX-like permease family protein [Nitratireductor aestuarii]GGA68420.1 peptide ABC transporter permease [Nitratireductor aestuarii]